MKLNVDALREELNGQAGRVQLKLKISSEPRSAVSVREQDSKILVTINPKRIHSEKQWDEHKEWLTRRIGGNAG